MHLSWSDPGAVLLKSKERNCDYIYAIALWNERKFGITRKINKENNLRI